MKYKSQLEKYIEKEGATPEGFIEIIAPYNRKGTALSIAITVCQDLPSGYMRKLDEYRKK